jgi:Mg2+/citrate symporter
MAMEMAMAMAMAMAMKAERRLIDRAEKKEEDEAEASKYDVRLKNIKLGRAAAKKKKQFLFFYITTLCVYLSRIAKTTKCPSFLLVFIIGKLPENYA